MSPVSVSPDFSVEALKLRTIDLFLIVVFMIFTAGKSIAATYYVSPAGSDSKSGLTGSPFRTIQKAANVVNPGDTVYVRGGTYNERVALTRSGSSRAYITVRNYPGETAILDGTGLGNGRMFLATNVSWLKIIGFKIRNYTGAGIQIQSSGTYSGSHIEIRDNEIYNSSFEGGDSWAIIVAAWPWGSTNSYTDITVDGNYIHDVKTGVPSSYNEALTLAGRIDRLQITNNIIDNASFIGIDLVGRGSQYPRDGIVSGNEVKNSGYDRSTSAIYIDGAKNITIEDNKVHDNTGVGIDEGAEEPGFVTENIIVRRNKVWNNDRQISIGGGYRGTSRNSRIVQNTAAVTVSGKHDIYYLAKGRDHVGKNNIGYFRSKGTFFMLEHGWDLPPDSQILDYNAYYPASLSGMHYWYGTNSSFYSSFSAYQSATGQDAHSIAKNPLFTNIGSFDFTLQSGSPCIDAGDFLTRTTSSGSGTVIPVEDARYFEDGYGISGVSGDTIMVGSHTVRVKGVNYTRHTVTADKSISWNKGDGVSYPYSGDRPDIGAFEHSGHK